MEPFIREVLKTAKTSLENIFQIELSNDSSYLQKKAISLQIFKDEKNTGIPPASKWHRDTINNDNFIATILVYGFDASDNFFGGNLNVKKLQTSEESKFTIPTNQPTIVVLDNQNLEHKVDNFKGRRAVLTLFIHYD